MNRIFRIIGKRGLALFLALMMCVTMLPVAASAEEVSDETDAAASVVIGEATKYYTTVQEAVNAAENSATVTLLKSSEENVAVSGDITLALQHYTLFGSLTVESTAKLTVTGGDNPGAAVIENGTLGGAVTNKGTLALTGSCHVDGAVINSGTLHIDSGVFSETGTIENQEGGKCSITGGSFAYDPSELGIADGYKAVKREDGSWSVYDSSLDYCVSVKTDETVSNFETLQDAVEAAEAGSTVTVLRDISVNGSVTVDKQIILDLNGNQVTFGDVVKCFDLTVGADVTVTGSGTVTGAAAEGISGTYYGTFVVAEGARLTIENGTFTDGKQIVSNKGTTVIKDGIFTSEVCTPDAPLLYTTGASSKLTVLGGAFTAKEARQGTNGMDGMYGIYAAKGASLVLGTAEGGPSVTSGLAAVGLNNLSSDPAVSIKVYGGTYTSTIASAPNTKHVEKFNTVLYLSGKSNVEISGGTFKAEGTANEGDDQNPTYAVSLPYENVAVDLKISGGYFESRNSQRDIFYVGEEVAKEGNAEASVSISGGIFCYEKIPESYLAEDCALGMNSGGKWQVVSLDEANASVSYEAGDGTTKYTSSLRTAIDCVKEGGTVTLLKDIRTESSFPINKSFTLEGNKKTITADKVGGSLLKIEPLTPSASLNVMIKDVTINGSMGRAVGLMNTTGSTLSLENVTVEDGAYYGIMLHTASNAKVTVTGSSIKGGTALYITSSDNAAVDADGSSLIGTKENSVVFNNTIGARVTAGELTGAINSGKTGNLITVAGVDYVIPVSTSYALEDAQAEVTTQEDKICRYPTFAEAFEAAKDNDTVTLLKNVELSSKLTVDKAITLDGNGKTIESTVTDGQGTILVTADGVKIDSLTVTGEKPATHGIQVYGGKNVVLNNVKIENMGKDGLLVNGGAVVTATDLTTSGNAWGGVNVDNGSSFTADGYKSENEKAMVWSEDFGTENGSTIKIAGFVTVYALPGEGKKVHFMTEAEAKEKAVAKTGDAYYGILQAALNAAEADETVTLLQDVTEDATLSSGKAVTLDATGHIVKATVMVDNGALTIAGGAFDTTDRGSEGTADHCLIAWNSDSTIIVNGGTYKAGCTVAYAADGGNVEINDGDFSAEGNWGTKYLLNLKDNTESEIIVKGGTFHGYDPSNSNSENPKASFVAEDYMAIKNADGDYEVKTAANAVAEVNGTKYSTLKEALEAVEAGDTVTLLQNVELSSKLTVDKAITLDGNGKTIESTVTDGQGTILVTADGVKIDSLTVTGEKPATHGIQVYGGKNVVLNNVKIENMGKDGLLVNGGATVTATDLTTSGNAWGGVNVDNGSSFTADGYTSTEEPAMVWSEDFGTEGGSTVTVEGFVTVCGIDGTKVHFMPETEAQEKTAAKIGNVYYGTLQAALNAAANGDTVTLLKDVDNGTGVKLMAADAKKVTIDLDGHTYNAVEPLVGSTGTETQGFHFEKGNTVTVQNGTIRSNAPMVIQNYCGLTLKNLTVEGGEGSDYIVSCNAGNTTLENVNISGTKSSVVAMDVMHWHGRYETAPTVTINNTAKNTIAGKIAVYCYENGEVSDCANKASLFISGGSFSTRPDVQYFDNRNYGVKEANGLYSVLPRAVQSAAPAVNTVPYTGAEQQLVTPGVAVNGHFEYKLGDGEYSTVIPTATNAGSYRVAYRLVGNDGYADGYYSGEFQLQIGRAEARITRYPAPWPLIYNGSAQKLITEDGEVNSRELALVYRLRGETEWSENVPSATEIGTYVVEYMVPETDNYFGTGIQTQEVTIAPFGATITVSMRPYTCRAPEEPQILVVPEDRPRTVEYSADGVNWTKERPLTAGDYTVRVTAPATGNYAEVTASATFTVRHSFTGDWRYDANGHWHVCACGEAEEHAAHRENGGVRSGNEIVYSCIDCGYVIRTETVSNGGENGGGEVIDDPNVPLADPLPYDDVTEADENKGIKGDWFAADVRYMYENEIMKGLSDNSFGPENFLTRGQIVTILYRLEGEPEVTATKSQFTDVPANQFYFKAVVWATENGIAKGYSDTIFRPGKNVNREEMAAFMSRYATYKKYEKKTGDISKYADAAKVSSYAAEDMEWANATGLINGRTETTLAPQGTTKRCEAAAILTRFCKEYNVFPENAQ